MRIVQFTWRVGPDGSAGWSVVLQQEGLDAFGRPHPDGPLMTMQQATEAGYDLAAVLTGMNAASLSLIEAQAAQLVDQQALIAELRGQLGDIVAD